MEQATRNPMLGHLEPLVGEWETEATHPALPGTVVPGRATFAVVSGRATFEWLAGGHYLIWRERGDQSGADPSSDWPGG